MGADSGEEAEDCESEAASGEDMEASEGEEEESEDDDRAAPSPDAFKAFIGAIPWSAEEKQSLRKHFEGCGEIAQMDLPNKLAFVTFKSSAALEKALQFDGKPFNGGTLKV